MSQKKEWVVELGIRVCPIRFHNPRNRNLLNTHISLREDYIVDYRRYMLKECRKEHYMELLEIEDEVDFEELIVDIIEDVYDGEPGSYWVGGRYNYGDTRQNIFNCPVMIVEYDGNDLLHLAKRTKGVKTGYKRSPKRLYAYYKKFDVRY